MTIVIVTVTDSDNIRHKVAIDDISTESAISRAIKMCTVKFGWDVIKATATKKDVLVVHDPDSTGN